MLYLVATPIGNLKDITLRALETLKAVDTIICEDTRRTKILLDHYQIHKPLIVLNDFNENKEYIRIIQRLQSGENLALVSDAGTPLINDPGYKLVRECIQQGLEVDTIPGPSAVIAALTLSGLPPSKFMYLGYIPEKPGARLKMYEEMQQISKITPTTFVIFVSPYKLIKPLEEMKVVLRDIEITLANELTKMFQKVETQIISSWLETLKKKPPKGEYVMLINLTMNAS